MDKLLLDNRCDRGSLNNDEIYYAICAILDNRINSAQSNYISEMTNNLLDSPCVPDDDIPDIDLP